MLEAVLGWKDIVEAEESAAKKGDYILRIVEPTSDQAMKVLSTEKVKVALESFEWMSPTNSAVLLWPNFFFDVDVNDILFLITQKFTDWASVTFSKVPPINHLELAPPPPWSF